MSELPIKTTVVGSYPVPAWLAAFPSTPNLIDALMVVTKTQELAGLDVISDGELSRFDVNHPETNGMIEYFIRPMDGITVKCTPEELARFRNQPGMSFRTRPAGVIRGKIDTGTLNLPSDFEMMRKVTRKPLKFTVTSPYMLVKTLLDVHYGDRKLAALSIADVLRKQIEQIDADVLQVDEANLPGSPGDSLMAAQVINRVLGGARGHKAVHLCFGNYGGQSIQRGQYSSLMTFFNALDCDHLVLEFARRGPGELELYRELKPEIALGVGVIDIKDNEIETADEVAKRIEQAVRILGSERIKWVHPDCGFWMLHRNVADGKMRALVKGRNLFCAS
jgi:5-methyltetrahydropteroyltriglutamate--homocysteine methyltransferase